jgi:hypothetical protein
MLTDYSYCYLTISIDLIFTICYTLYDDPDCEFKITVDTNNNFIDLMKEIMSRDDTYLD